MTNEQLTDKVVELDERTVRHTGQIKSAFNRIDELHAVRTGSATGWIGPKYSEVVSA